MFVYRFRSVCQFDKKKKTKFTSSWRQAIIYYVFIVNKIVAKHNAEKKFNEEKKIKRIPHTNSFPCHRFCISTACTAAMCSVCALYTFESEINKYIQMALGVFHTQCVSLINICLFYFLTDLKCGWLFHFGNVMKMREREREKKAKVCTIFMH